MGNRAADVRPDADAVATMAALVGLVDRLPIGPTVSDPPPPVITDGMRAACLDALRRLEAAGPDTVVGECLGHGPTVGFPPGCAPFATEAHVARALSAVAGETSGSHLDCRTLELAAGVEQVPLLVEGGPDPAGGLVLLVAEWLDDVVVHLAHSVDALDPDVEVVRRGVTPPPTGVADPPVWGAAVLRAIAWAAAL